MMCLACEQDAMWLMYLESQGLLKPDDPAEVEALFAAFPVQPLPVQPERSEQSANTSGQVQTNPFSCDDPTAGAADLKFLQTSRKPE
jgi:hypothetical protein